MNPSPARNLFDQIVANASPAMLLQSYISSSPPTFETEYLDFKGCAKLQPNEDKKIWSEALSGFANTGGGLLVWGLDCRPGPDGIDCVSGDSPCPDAEAFASRLRQLHPHSTIPALPGVEVTAVQKNPGTSEGYVLAYIPEGRHKPYRAESKNQNYYIRVGDNFRIPAVEILRSLFHPGSAPSFKAFVACDNGMVTIRIENVGVVSAYDTAITIDTNDPTERHADMPEWGQRWRGNLHVTSTALIPIHPEWIADSVRFSYSYIDPTKIFTIKATIYARDMQPQRFTFSEIGNHIKARDLYQMKEISTDIS